MLEYLRKSEIFNRMKTPRITIHGVEKAPDLADSKVALKRGLFFYTYTPKCHISI